MTVDSLLLQIDNSIEKNQKLYVCREGPENWRGGMSPPEPTYVPLSYDPGDVIAVRAWARELEKENTEQASQLLDPDATCCAEASRIHKEQRLKIEGLEKRRDELLVTIRNLSATVPYPDEAGNAGVLLAEVGTLRAAQKDRDHLLAVCAHKLEFLVRDYPGDKQCKYLIAEIRGLIAPDPALAKERPDARR